MFKIELSDRSYMFVESGFNLVLFEKAPLKAVCKTSVDDYFKNTENYLDLVVCDMVNDKLIPLTLSVTKIDAYSGPINQRIKKVEDIAVGDQVMGPDKKPREVLELHRGQDEMYEIESEDGNKHVVNGGHVLPLYDIETKQVLNMPVFVYLNLTDEDKAKLKLMKAEGV